MSRIIRVIILVASFNLITACASVSENVFGSEHENVMPFAEQTVQSLGGENLDFRAAEFGYLRVLYDEEALPLAKLSEQLQLADRFRSGIVQYSVELLRIAEMPGAEEAQVSAYAATFMDIRPQFVTWLQVDEGEYDAVVESIRAETTLLGALRKAQPLLDRGGQKFDDFALQIEEVTLVAAVAYLDATIEDHFEIFMDYNKLSVIRRDEILAGLTLLRKYRRGDERALDQLREAKIVLNKDLAIPSSPTETQLRAIEDYLLAETRVDHELANYMSADVTAYLQAHAELEREEAEVLAALTVARLQIVAWTRAHQAMSQGVKDPGNWLKIALAAAERTKQVLTL